MKHHVVPLAAQEERSTGLSRKSRLKRLDEDDWQRIGTTPTRGTLTIEAYARYLADHDREHLGQLEATRIVVAP